MFYKNYIFITETCKQNKNWIKTLCHWAKLGTPNNTACWQGYIATENSHIL